ncbi:MAG: hypothetical protein AAFN77_06925 [Planctomycetota bacterium]
MLIRTRTSLICFLGLFLLAGSASFAQENDPTANSEMIDKTISKIRDVERLDSFLEQNKALKAENAKLKASVASIQKELAKLKADLEQQNVKIRKQLLQMPTFQVQSKVIAGKRSVAYLKTKTTSLRVRANMEMSVPVADGVWVLMRVKEISKDMIVLEFPELERTVYLYH